MKQSDDSSGIEPPAPRPEPRQQQPPDYPYTLALTRTRDFGMQPIYFRAGTTEKFEAEFCPHLPEWRWMESAKQDEPPCTFAMANPALKGCPSGQEAECGSYVMHRCAGRSPQRSRVAKGVPFVADPKPDKNPLREPPDPDWVNE